MEHLRLVPFRFPIRVSFFLYLLLKTFLISNLSTLSTFIDLSFFFTSEEKQFQCSLVCGLWFCLLFISCFFLPRTARSFFPRSWNTFEWSPMVSQFKYFLLFSFISPPNNFFLGLQIISGNWIFFNSFFQHEMWIFWF